MMNNVVRLHKRHAYKVDVTQGDGMYTAECDALHLVTEAETFEALTARVWELVPDMIAANGLNIDVNSLRLQFNFTQSSVDTRIAM
jgi:hypothetical protein